MKRPPVLEQMRDSDNLRQLQAKVLELTNEVPYIKSVPQLRQCNSAIAILKQRIANIKKKYYTVV